MMGEIAEKIRGTLEKAFAPEALEVRDKSHLHAGHAGSRPEGETHFEVRIKARAFSGQNRLARHRLVHSALAELLAARVHALEIQASAPEKGDVS